MDPSVLPEPATGTVPEPRLDDPDPLETRREHEEWVRMRQREGAHHTAMLKRDRSKPKHEQIVQLRIEGKSERGIEQITKCSRGMVRRVLARHKDEIAFERNMAALRAATERRRAEVRIT